MEQNRFAPACGAPNSVRCPGWHGQRAGRSRENATLLSSNSPNCPVSPRAMVEFANGRLPSQSDALEGQEQSAMSDSIGLSGVPPDCPVCHKDRRHQRSIASNPNDPLTWHAPNNKQCRVWCAPDCPVCPSTESVQSLHSIQEQRIHSKHTFKAFNPLQVS
jgi:hypothetical protein